MRRARVLTALAAATLAAGAVGAGAGGTGGKPGDATTLVLWPAGAPAFVYPHGGTGRTARVADLDNGRLSVRVIPDIAPGDFPVSLRAVGRWLVYNGDHGVSAIADTFGGHPHVLGRATYFVPAAAANEVLLVRAERGTPVTVQRVDVPAARRRGPPLRLPPGTVGVVEGSFAGLVLVSQHGALQTWRPHRPARTVANLHGLRADAGFAADARLVAYGSGCRIEEATSGFSHTPVGYQACATLNVADLVTHARYAFAAPRGTVGWAPAGFGANAGIAPGDRMLAAAAVLPPASRGRSRLFLVSLAHTGATGLPSSTARLFARTAWSPDGNRLFYEGPNERLRAFDVRSGHGRQLRIPCCRYTAMLAIGRDGRARARRSPATSLQTTRTFRLGAGRAVRTFTFRERSGVILLNRLTVPRGVRAVVDARIPGLAGARVVSWPSRDDPSLQCRGRGRLVVCTQGEEWCPMPRATWHFRLVKLGGPAGAVRFDYVVAPPPGPSSRKARVVLTARPTS